ncbi:MAG TPA: hypothetical protein VF389_10065 [Woeseiaceae bacterium]
MSDQKTDNGAARQWVREAVAQSGSAPAVEMTYAVGGVAVQVRGAHTALVLIPASHPRSDGAGDQ